MLIAGHIGYTVGAVWTLKALTRSDTSADYRAVAVMALAPDIIDRALFIFALPSGVSGRLIAHTLLFQLAILVVITLVRRRWWLYGAASSFHLLLDSTGLSAAWARHLLWPLIGAEWSLVNILPGTGGMTVPYQNWVWLRSQQALQPYGEAPWWVWLLEAGGAVILLAFANRKTLYKWPRLRRFLAAGEL